MILPKRTLPSHHSHLSSRMDHQIESLPFYIKEAGYLNDRKFMRGNRNNYSDYLFLYSLTSMSFTKNKERNAVNPHDVVVSACNTPLTFVQPRSHIQDFIYVTIGGTHAQLFYNFIRKNNCIYHANQLSNILDHFLALLAIDYDNRPLLAQMEAGSLIHQLLLDLYKLSLNILEAKSMTPVQDTAVNTAIKFIHENYAGNLDIDTICGSVSFSKYYFCKLFKEHMGMTVHQYVTEYRINKSKELLSYSKLSIAAIAGSVGVQNARTYTRCFEKLQHMTPSQYREYY